MKLGYTIKQKTKIAAILFGIMICTILIRIAEDKSIKNISEKIKSMYNDRLVPATDLFYISENIHAKQLSSDQYLQNKASFNSQTIHIHNVKIDSLLKKYERTFLTVAEKKELAAFKLAYANHLLLEKQLYLNTALANNANAIEKSYRNLFQKLNSLTKIQSQVGEELIKNVQTILNGTQVYTHLQYILSIIIGVLIMGLLMASKVVSVQSEKFNLN